MSVCGKIRGLNSFLAFAFVLSGSIISSCSSKVKVEGFDNNAWKQDTSACNNTRIQLVDKLINNKQSLVSHKDERIMDYLGKPDNTVFFARGKKTLIYSIVPKKSCPSFVNGTSPKSFRIDIDALGRAELVYILNQ